MRRSLRHKYRKARINFKQELRDICQQDNTLRVLIWEAHRAENNNNVVFKMYHWLGTKYHDIYEEFCDTEIWGGTYCGEYGIWQALLQTYSDFAKKYIYKIPQKCAMGDALAVVYRLDKENK
jgi:hypothetical protein